MRIRHTARDDAIDWLRGIAILTMVEANTAGLLLANPHPLLLRALGSIAAPLFFSLAAMMVVLSHRQKGRTLRHFVLRGAAIIAVGATLDMILWGQLPFQTFDVLYPLGLSMPLALVALRMPTAARWACLVTLVGSAPILQHVVGYSAQPVALRLSQIAAFPGNIPVCVRQMLVDGWFPLCPWLGFTFLGVHLAVRRWPVPAAAPPAPSATPNVPPVTRPPLLAMAMLAIGAACWLPESGSQYVRSGFSELFYPPTVAYFVAAGGAVIVLLYLGDLVGARGPWRPVRLLGQRSLLLYVLHLVIAALILRPLLGVVRLWGFCLLYAAMCAVLFATPYAISAISSRWRRAPASPAP
ncbi:MAG TPA: heparan-alpha-glucosaminide N-acetyltransferase domain-containing protein [Verrucomicrobiae bacterium]|nr:heparan-alpha-glucosaminide N-acetyltransferase domain-containing protein [Verrucomicrobiae bacterium]